MLQFYDIISNHITQMNCKSKLVNNIFDLIKKF